MNYIQEWPFAIPGFFTTTMKYLIVSIILFSSIPANAQWRKVADFWAYNGGAYTSNEGVTCVYFLDLPGPPRIGFVGTESSLFKTTDGGQSWVGVWDTGISGAHFDVTGICFKDSLIGWFSVFNGYSPNELCYRTIDGGNNWYLLNVPSYNPWGAYGVAYDSASGRLFLSSDTEIRISNDLGNTWPDSLAYFTFSYSFASPLRGIVDAMPSWEYKLDTFTTIVYLTTSDGGITWDTIYPQGFSPGIQPRQTLAVPGTSTCFTADWGDTGRVWRSDDFGRNWRKVGSIPVDDYCMGYIHGDFSRLYIQAYTAMYVSTDSGVTWINDGGPYAQREYAENDFYAAKGVTFAGESGQPGGMGLWEEDWPQSGVAEQPSVIDSATASPNPVSTGTIISFGISKETYVKIEVFDILGNRVPTAGFESLFEPGNKAVPISLQGLPAGTYFARIVTAYGEVQTVKLVKE